MAANTNPENFSENESDFSEPDFNITPIHTKISPIIRAVERVIITANDDEVKKYFGSILAKFQSSFGDLSPSDEDFSLDCYRIISVLNNDICDGARALTLCIPFLYGCLYGFIERAHVFCRAAIVEYDYQCGAFEYYDVPPPINEQELSYNEKPGVRHLPVFDDELDYFHPLSIFLRNLEELKWHYLFRGREHIPAGAPAHARPAEDTGRAKRPSDNKRRKDDFFY